MKNKKRTVSFSPKFFIDDVVEKLSFSWNSDTEKTKTNVDFIGRVCNINIGCHGGEYSFLYIISDGESKEYEVFENFLRLKIRYEKKSNIRIKAYIK